MMYGKAVVIFLSLFHQLSIVECFPASECERGAMYFSVIVDDCVECPRNPTINCQFEALKDIAKCKRSCIVENVKTTPAATTHPGAPSKEPGYEVATHPGNDVTGAAKKQNGGHDKLFLTGIGVAVVGSLALGLLVHTYIKRRKIRQPTFAGCRLIAREKPQENAPVNV